MSASAEIVPEVSIRARGAGVQFRFDNRHRVVTPMLSRLRRKGETAWGLRNVDLDLGPGSGVALLGKSGSGKTTLLRLMAGVMHPDEGEIETRGRIASLLSIRAGVIGLLTGRENTHLLCTLAGLTHADARERADEVKELSRLGSAFERPVSSYSQGMRARLGFSGMRLIEPELMLLDEVHEAFDHEFREIVHKEADALLARGGVVVAAGHDHEMLQRFCTSAIHMSGGEVMAIGDFGSIRSAYIDAEGHDTGD